VVVQICLSFALLVAGSLLVESLEKIRNANPGDFPRVAFLKYLHAVWWRRATMCHAPGRLETKLIDRVRVLPGVESAAFARLTQLGYGSYSSASIRRRRNINLRRTSSLQWNITQVGPGYLATMGNPTHFCREFTRADNENTGSGGSK